MTTGRLLAFTGFAVLLALAPGPDFALVTRNALAHGRRGVLLTTSGLTAALVLWISAMALGLATLLASSANVYTALKLAGAAYLAYLGLRTLWESRRDPPPLTDQARSEARPPAAVGILSQGFLSASLNPKLGVFFVSVLPQFVDRNSPALPQLLVFGAIFTVVGIGWMTVYGLSISRLRAIVTAPRVRRWSERVTGIALLGFGARLVADRG